MNRNRFCSLLSSSSSSLLKQKAPSPQQQLRRIQLPSSSIPTSNSSINCYHCHSSTSVRHQFHYESRINVVTPTLSQIETTSWNITTSQQPQLQLQKRYFSWTGARGYDLTNDTLDDYDKEMGIPKINVSGYDENGFVVKNMIQKVNSNSNNSKNTSRPSFVDIQSNSEADSDGSVYMNGSIIVYPTGCFLWNIPKAASITSAFQSSTSSSNQSKNRYSNNLEESKHIIPIESLVSIVLIRPHIEYLFIGCGNERSITNLNEIQYYFRNVHPIRIVVEQMQLYNAIGTFNLLNAEDRQVAAALIADSTTTNLS